MTPRQRPKAYQLTPVSNNHFSIGLPPSPSPRNVLSSPGPAKTPDNFNAQFEVDFNNIDQQQQQTPVISQVNTSVTANAVFKQPQPVTQQIQQLNSDAAKFENLFKSSFPDPFEEIVQIQTNYVEPQAVSHPEPSQQQQNLFESPVESQQQQASAKVNQHRRYMSDTSGFKR